MEHEIPGETTEEVEEKKEVSNVHSHNFFKFLDYDCGVTIGRVHEDAINKKKLTFIH